MMEKPKPKVATLLTEITALKAALETAHESRRAELAARANAEKETRELREKIKEIRDQFADLKERIVVAEEANQYMRGYLARVQEDDVVREELVTTGELGGEQMLQPKRKPTRFDKPNSYAKSNERPEFGYTDMVSERRKPRHFISY